MQSNLARVATAEEEAAIEAISLLVYCFPLSSGERLQMKIVRLWWFNATSGIGFIPDR